MSKLALLGGPKAISEQPPADTFAWPIITDEDREAVLSVLNNRQMSGTGITEIFEKEYAAWQGSTYGLGCNNGTSALLSAMFAVGLGRDDEMICPSITYWASCIAANTLGARLVFAEVDPYTLCLDPNDIERHITPRTKVIMVVHYVGHPADMDPIMAIAKKHNLKVIEDVSHAQGALYKGRKVGAIGDASGASLMTGKSFAIGEAGIMCTNDRETYERAIAFGHYERFSVKNLETENLKYYTGVPLGGHKFRMHQMSAAVGRVQLKYYDERCAEIQKAMNYFWDLLEGVPGLRAHRTKGEGYSMGGWYSAHGIYETDELGGLSATRFMEAVKAEGFATAGVGCNRPLHIHPTTQRTDVYGEGGPKPLTPADDIVMQAPQELPVSMNINNRVYFIPWFKKFYPEIIEQYANAFRKVAENYQELLPGDTGNPENGGGWNFFFRGGH